MKWKSCGLSFILLLHLASGPSLLQAVPLDEAAVLWETAQEGFAAGDYEKALFLFRRYRAQYPGAPFFLKSDALIGKCLLKLKRPKEARVFLHSWISSGVPEKETIEARIDLAEVYFQQKKFTEVLMVAKELEGLQKKNLLSEEEILSRWTLLARAWAGLKKWSQALDAIETAIHLLSDHVSVFLKGEIYQIRLQLKYQQCLDFSLKKDLSEIQLKSSLQEQGFCLLESIPFLREIFKIQNFPQIDAVKQGTQKAWKQYEHNCYYPNLRALNFRKAKKLNESVEEVLGKNRYRKELIHELLEVCREKKSLALNLLKIDRSSFSPQTQMALDQLIKSFNELFYFQYQKKLLKK